MVTRRQQAMPVETDEVGYADIDDPEEWAMLRAVVISTTPESRSTVLPHSKIMELLNNKAVVDPYDTLPDVEAVYPHELARDTAVGLFLVYDRVLRYALEHPRGSKQESEEGGNHQREVHNMVKLIDQAYQLTIEEIVEQVFQQTSVRMSADAFKLGLLKKIRAMDLRALGRDRIVAALESQQKKPEAMSRLEQTLAKFEEHHLVAKLPDGAYVVTQEGLESYLHSPFSEVQLFLKNPI